MVALIVVEYTPERFVSAATFDSAKRMLKMTSFSDNEHYSCLEGLMIQMNPTDSEQEFRVHIQIPNIKQEREKIIEKLGEIKYEIEDVKLKSGNIKEAVKALMIKDQKFYESLLYSEKKSIPVMEALIAKLGLGSEPTNMKQLDLSKL